MLGPSPHDTEMRRSRVACQICGRPVELVRMREHLRSEHQLGSAEVDTKVLDARIEARRSRRSHQP